MVRPTSLRRRRDVSAHPRAKQHHPHYARIWLPEKAGNWPIVNPDHACNPECTSLEDLFTQTLSDYQQRSRLLSGLAQEAKAQSDDSTWRFLTLLAEEQQQDGLLLQSVLEEIRNADKAGLGMEQTDRRLMAIVGEAQKAH